jgi:hypothetical protein
VWAVEDFDDDLLADEDLIEQLQEGVADILEAVEARTKGPGAPAVRAA